MIKRFCDRCYVELESGHKTVFIAMANATSKFEKYDFSEISGMYCKKCAGMVSDILESEPDQDTKDIDQEGTGTK